MSETHTTLASNLRRIRHDRGLSQTALARSAGLWTTHVQALENGRIKKPLLPTIVALADALDCSLDELCLEPAA